MQGINVEAPKDVVSSSDGAGEKRKCSEEEYRFEKICHGDSLVIDEGFTVVPQNAYA